MDNSENKILGDYELLDLLGTGAQGQVYRGRCMKAGKEFVEEGEIVAVKILSRGSGDPMDDKRFKRQADILEHLSHPSICRYIDYFSDSEGEFDEMKCLVMEFLDGQALNERLRRYPSGLPWEEVKPIFEQCLSGLSHAAEKGVIHRDLKPSNIFITRDGLAKLIDFGIARQEGGEETSTAGWKGSFDYMSPDFVSEEGFHGDEQSDVFSMGVCFFIALTGELPFPAFGENAHIGYLNRWKGEQEPRPTFQHKVFRVLTKVKPFILGSLARDREERFETFDMMLEALQDIRYRIVRHRGKEDYELIDMLGRGGFGEVFKGRAVSNAQLVAIKHLFAGRQASRFIKEAKLLQKYEHPDIVKYHDFIEVEGIGDDKEFFLVMEYLPGMPGAGLNSRIRKSRTGLQAAEVIEIFIHYLSALQFLHESPRPIIHRDIKPGNLYAPPGQPQKAKLFDLGVARDVSGTLTTGMIPGTLDYMAPEFAKSGSDRGSPQSDIYAMGVSLYEALVGKRPFPRLPKADQEAFIQFVARAQNPPPVEYSAQVFREVPELTEIVRTSLENNPKRRYKSSREMLGALEELLTQICGDQVDEEDVPTRATIADPELIERLKAHQADRPERIPSSEMQTADESGQPVDVQARPEWLEEESTPEPQPAPAGTTPFLTPTGAPMPGQKRKPVALIGIAAVAVIALGLAAFLARDMFENPRDEFLASVKEMSTPVADEAYVRRLMSKQAEGKVKMLDDLDYKDSWDNWIFELEDLGEQVPAEYTSAFAAAFEQEDLPAAQAIADSWANLGDAASFMGLSQRQYVSQLDEMRDQISRFNFVVEINELRGGLPAEIVTAADVAAAEATAARLTAARAEPRSEVPQAEQDAAFNEIRDALVALFGAYVGQQSTAVTAAYEAGDDAAEPASQYLSLRDTAPTLVQLVSVDYDRGLAAVQGAADRYQRMQQVASTMQNLRDAVPESITRAEDVVMAEQTLRAVESERLRTWEGISDEDKTQALDGIRADITELVRGYVAALEAKAVDRYAALEQDVSEDNDLTDLIDSAPTAVTLLSGAYEDAVQHVAEARMERNRQVMAAAELQEQQRLEAERQARALADQQERDRLAAQAEANLAAYQAEVTRLQALVPGAIASSDELAAGNLAAEAVDAFALQEWHDVSTDQRDQVADSLQQSLVGAAEAYVTGLYEDAKIRIEAGESDAASWTDLRAAKQTAPELIALVEGTYDSAVLDVEMALRKQLGINEFTVALESITRLIPARPRTADDLASLESAARSFTEASEKPWDVVSEKDRTTALARIRGTIEGRASGYIAALRDRALGRYASLEDADAERNALSAMKTSTPTLVEFVPDTYAEAVTAVEVGAQSMAQRRSFAEAVAKLDAAVPSSLTAAEDRTRAEQAVQMYNDVNGRRWEGIPDADRTAALEAKRTALVDLATSYINESRGQAVNAYRSREDGEAGRAALVALDTDAPSVRAWVQEPYDQAVAEVAAARAAWESVSEFARSTASVLQATPKVITSADDLSKAEQAAQTYASVSSEEWEGIPPDEREEAFARMRLALMNSGRSYIDTLRDSAVARYDKLENADADRDRLIAIQQSAPALVSLLGPSYQTAMQSVDAARSQKAAREEAITAEQARQERERAERERLAQLREAEEQRLAGVQTAWVEVQQAWAANEDKDLSGAYQTILGATFTVREVNAPYQQVRQSLMNGLNERVVGSIGQANQAIAGYRSFLYQVLDPTYGNYRMYEDETPRFTVSLPPTDDLGDVDLGVSQADLLRLRAWDQFAGVLDDAAEKAKLADTLTKIGVAANQKGESELANLCHLESALVESEPAMFPSRLESAEEPPEIFRWRAHAGYQPEGSSAAELRELAKYAKRGGQLNQYDVQLALFAAYYTWRNYIEGESQYAVRVRESLRDIIDNADPTVANEAMDFVLSYIEGGGEDDEEFPGLYIVSALSSIDSDSELVKQATSWLQDNESAYQVRLTRIRPQLDLLKKLLMGA